MPLSPFRAWRIVGAPACVEGPLALAEADGIELLDEEEGVDAEGGIGGGLDDEAL